MILARLGNILFHVKKKIKSGTEIVSEYEYCDGQKSETIIEFHKMFNYSLKNDSKYLSGKFGIAAQKS